MKKMTKERLNKEFINACKHGDLPMVKYVLLTSDFICNAEVGAYNNEGFKNAFENKHFHIVDFLLTSSEIPVHVNVVSLACQNTKILDYILYELNWKFTDADKPLIERNFFFRKDLLDGFWETVKKSDFIFKLEREMENKTTSPVKVKI